MRPRRKKGFRLHCLAFGRKMCHHQLRGHRPCLCAVFEILHSLCGCHVFLAWKYRTSMEWKSCNCFPLDLCWFNIQTWHIDIEPEECDLFLVGKMIFCQKAACCCTSTQCKAFKAEEKSRQCDENLFELVVFIASSFAQPPNGSTVNNCWVHLTLGVPVSSIYCHKFRKQCRRHRWI